MPLGREQKLWRASGRVEKWKNNEESYVNKTQQQTRSTWTTNNDEKIIIKL